MILGMGVRVGASLYGAGISLINWLLPNSLNLTATIGEDATFTRASTVTIPVWDATLGLVYIAEDANKVAVEGMRRTGAGVYVNDDGSGGKLTPPKLGSNSEEIMLLYPYWTAKSYNSGDKIYVVGTDNHNYSLSSQGGASASMPSVDKTDIGSTVSDGVVTWDVESYYTNMASATKNHLTGLALHPAFTQYMVNPYTPINQTILNLPIGDYHVSVIDGTATIAAGTAVGTGFGSATKGSPVAVNITTAGSATMVLAGSPTGVNVINVKGLEIGVDNPGTEGDGSTAVGAATSETVPNPLRANNFALRFRAQYFATGGTQFFYGETNAFDVRVVSGTSWAFRKYTSGGSINTSEVYAPAEGEVVYVGVVASDTTGIDIYVQGAKGTTSADTDDFVEFASFNIGSTDIPAFHVGGVVTDNTYIESDDAAALEAFASDTTWDDPE